MGLIPEEIVRKFGHLSLAQVHAALAYYHATRRRSTRIWKPRYVRQKYSNSSAVAHPYL